MAAARIFPIVAAADLVFFGGVVLWARRGRTGIGALRMGLRGCGNLAPGWGRAYGAAVKWLAVRRRSTTAAR